MSISELIKNSHPFISELKDTRNLSAVCAQLCKSDARDLELRIKLYLSIVNFADADMSA